MMETKLPDDLLTRRKRVQNAMQQMNVDGCLLTMDVNLYYMTGRVFSGYFYLPTEGEPVSFVKRPNDFTGEGVASIRKPEQIAEFFTGRGMSFPKRLLLETDEITYNECIRLQEVFQSPETGNATTLMRRVRMIKTPWEIEQFRLSARQHALTYSEIPSCFRPGMTDVAFQAGIEQRMRLNGSFGVFHAFGSNMDIFMGSVLTGSNAEAPSPYDFALGGGGQVPLCPIGANGTVLKEGMAVMVDMVGNYTAYLTDMTRVFATGKLPELAYRAHQTSIGIQEKIMQTARPGVACAALYDLALAEVEKQGLAGYFMGTRQQAKFVGHGIGLQINEPPVLTSRSKEELQPGMMLALEPKFVIPGVGAVGIENSFLVTETGLEKITLFEEDIIPIY
ncbi:MAG: Xaa-Pro peptidase family protein [Tannerella sp.]|jgi:Xaa-Pro aminopeptidase|nr:Xaa-Pro peptidase family protein [Tannerella sp.]